MQKSIWQASDIKTICNSGVVNGYCDLDKSLCDEFDNLQNEKLESFDDIILKELYRYILLKCLLAYVSEIVVKTNRPKLAFQVMQELNLGGVILFNESNLDLSLKSDTISQGLFIENLADKSDKEISSFSELSGKNKLPVYIKFCESLDEAGSLDKTYSKSPARVLEDFGLLDRKAYLIGCNFLDKDDAEILAGYDASIIITPSSDMKLGKGAINLQMLIGQGIELRLGSGENHNIDMLLEGKLACGNTANLMYDNQAVSFDEIISILKSSRRANTTVLQQDVDKQKTKVYEMLKEKI